VESWDDEGRHQALLELIYAEGELAWGARKYRGVLRDRPDDEAASARLEKLVKSAEAELVSMAAKREAEESGGGAPYRGVLIVFLVLLMAAGAGAIYFMVKKAQKANQDPAPRSAPARSP
jgi:hypothetical protein